MNDITHVVLAGDKDYARYLLDGKDNKCLIEFSRKKLLTLTLSALDSASEVRRVIFVGPSKLEATVPKSLNGKPLLFLPQRGSLSENVKIALRAAEQNWPGGRIVFLTNDAPLLTASELDTFATSIWKSDQNITIGVCKILDHQLSDPLIKQYIRSIVFTSDGLFLLANQIALRDANAELLKTLQHFFDVRKQSRFIPVVRNFAYALGNRPMRSGIGGWLRLVLAKQIWLLQRNSALASRISLSCKEIEDRLTKLLQCKSHVAIVELKGGLGCFDADTDDQLRELRRILTQTVEPLLVLEESRVYPH